MTGRRAACALAASALLTPSGQARVLLTQEQALKEAFPAATVERRTAWLTDEQARRIEQLAGSPPTSRVVPYYRAQHDGKPAGTAYFDTHLVRTLPETLMIVVGPDGTIARIEVLVFEEPPEHLPRKRWFDLFRGRRLDRELAAGRGLPLVTGATLTSRAVTAAARRALAIHAVLEEPGAAAGAAPPGTEPTRRGAPTPDPPRDPSAPEPPAPSPRPSRRQGGPPP